MTIAIRSILPGAMLLLMFATGSAARAQTAIVESPDGSAVVTIDGREIVLPAPLAARIAEVLRENAGDPQGLRVAVRDLVAGSAGGAEDEVLVATIAAVAVFKSNGDSDVVAAIVTGASAGNPAVSPQTLLARLPAVTTIAERRQPATRDPTRARPDTGARTDTGARSTMENPQQLSPAG